MWNIVYFVLPASGDVVWIRVVNYYSAPFLAEFNGSDKSFQSLDTKIVIPAYFVSRWKSQ